MARVYLMSWDGKNRRWLKEYTPRGGAKKKYAVSCRQLGLPRDQWTMDRSYQAANEWWKQKQAEIDAANRPPVRQPQPLDDLAAAYLDKTPEVFADGRALVLALMDRLGMLGRPRPLSAEDEVLKRGFVQAIDETAPGHLPKTPQESEAWVQAMGPVLREAVGHILQSSIRDGRPLPEEIAGQLPPARLQQIQDAVKSIRGEPAASPEKTIAAHAEAWLKRQQALVDAGQMTAARCANNRTCLAHLTAFLGPQTDADSIGAPKLEAFYLHVLGKIRRNGQMEGWSIAYAKDVFAVAKAFIRWLWEKGTIELPRNINGNFKFGSPAKAVRTWTVDEFKRAVGGCSGKLKLVLLLMANCGMTQVDVSDLRDAEVDWVEGRVIRKRSKTADRENVPTVNYLLWPTTFELLNKYRSGGERVLLTEAGLPYVRTWLREDGRLAKADGIASNYRDVNERLNLKRPLKQLRKLGASLLATHKDYGRFASFFLGHSPRNMADRHYVVPPQELFDEAVTWLGRQLGQVP